MVKTMTMNATTQPLRHIYSGVAVTLTHASYPSHSFSAVVFGAAKTCRNISRVASGRPGAQRKDCRPTVTGGGQEGGQANLVTLHMRQPTSTQKSGPKVTACVNLTLTHTQNTQKLFCQLCVLGKIPVTVSVLTHGVVMISAVLKAPLCCAVYTKIIWNILLAPNL